MTAYRLQPYGIVFAGFLLFACDEKPRGGVDWNSFDYRKTEQMSLPKDNDASYTAPGGTCIHNEICE